jgi:hypothetical protein
MKLLQHLMQSTFVAFRVFHLGLLDFILRVTLLTVLIEYLLVHFIS